MRDLLGRSHAADRLVLGERARTSPPRVRDSWSRDSRRRTACGCGPDRCSCSGCRASRNRRQSIGSSSAPRPWSSSRRSDREGRRARRSTPCSGSTPAALAQHDRNRGARAQVDADDVDAIEPVEIFRRGLLDRSDVGDAGVVDEDVDRGRCEPVRRRGRRRRRIGRRRRFRPTARPPAATTSSAVCAAAAGIAIDGRHHGAAAGEERARSPPRCPIPPRSRRQLFPADRTSRGGPRLFHTFPVKSKHSCLL